LQYLILGVPLERRSTRGIVYKSNRILSHTLLHDVSSGAWERQKVLQKVFMLTAHPVSIITFADLAGAPWDFYASIILLLDACISHSLTMFCVDGICVISRWVVPRGH
jgi:hypothetical protein